MSASDLPPGLQSSPALAGVEDGALAVWVDEGDGEARLRWTRLPIEAEVDTRAAPLTGESALERDPAVSARGTHAVAVWAAWGGAGLRVRAARLPAAGAPLPVPSIDVASASSAQRRPSVAVGETSALIAWEEEDGARSLARAARWPHGEAAPVPLGPVDAGAGSSQHWTRLLATQDRFVCVWSERPVAGGTSVRARVFDEAGTPIGASFDVSTPGAGADNPDLAECGARVLVVWNEPGGGGLRVSGRFVDVNAAATSGESFVLFESPASVFHTARLTGGSEAVLLALEQAPAGRRVLRARVDATGLLDPPQGDPLTDASIGAADPAVACAGGVAFGCWREPTPADDDDLYVARWDAAEGAAPAVVLPLTVAPPVSGVSDPSPARGLRAGPNPFRGAVRIHGGKGMEDRTIRILDVAGRPVRALRLPSGGGSVLWDGRDEGGRVVSPGVYFVHAGGDAAAVRLVRMP